MKTAAGLSALSPAAWCAAHCVWTRPAAARGDGTLMTFHRSRRIAGIPHADAPSAPTVEEGAGGAEPKPVQEAPFRNLMLQGSS